MRIHLFCATAAVVLLACTLSPAGEAATKPTTAPAEAASRNPDYAKWAALKEGAWVRVRIASTFRNVEWTTKLAKVTGDEVLLEVTEAKAGEKPGEPREERIPAAGKRPAAKSDDSGDEAVAVSGADIPCHWEKRGGDGSSEETTWTCDKIPGVVKRVSHLPADEKLALPESKAEEWLVAYDLPPRDEKAAAATRPAGGAAGVPARVAPPAKFSFTYAFDPPGWRHWSRTDEGHWQEQWETGQVVQFEVVGWVNDGPRRGTLVRRADGQLETVIPDAGKGDQIWFHSLPNGKWGTLGRIEESE